MVRKRMGMMKMKLELSEIIQQGIKQKKKKVFI